ncbi:hypothetical protein ACJJTC_014690 [Scirpophaga incertulas]
MKITERNEGSGAQAIYKKYGLEKALGRRRGAGIGGENFPGGPGAQPSPGTETEEEAAPGEGTVSGGGAAAKQPGRVGQAEKNTEPSAPTQKPVPGGSGTDPVPKVGTTQEAADRNADHRRQKTSPKRDTWGLAVCWHHLG